MRDRFEIPSEIRLRAKPEADKPSADRALKNLRYIVTAVNGDALKAWADLWEQLRSGVTPAGMVLPQMEQGFKPPCGWAEFLEKFWLLKHYLDYVQRLCSETRAS